MIDVCLVGSGGNMPLPGRALASALVRIGGSMILFDCGEGTQVALRKAGWGFGGLGTICLTHVHADHVSGLPGLLLTLGGSGRTEPVTIYGARWTTAVVQALRIIAPRLPYEVIVHELAGGESFDTVGGLLRTHPLNHGIECLGFRIDIPRSRRFLPERATARGIPVSLWKALQAGQAVSWLDGQAAPDDVLGSTRRGLAFAYVTDTRPAAGLEEFVKDVDLLVCESTYLAPGDEERAAEHHHMHVTESCALARAASVKHLWLTHISPAVPNPSEHVDYVASLFPSVEIGHDGLVTSLRFSEE